MVQLLPVKEGLKESDQSTENSLKEDSSIKGDNENKNTIQQD